MCVLTENFIVFHFVVLKMFIFFLLFKQEP